MLRLTPESATITELAQQQALAAPACDPLWLLARQWQLGEFAADDAGSAVQVRITSHTAPLLAGGVDGPPVTAIEPWVEAEPRPDWSTLEAGRVVGLGMALLQHLRDAGVAAARPALTEAFPFTPPTPGPWIGTFAGRIPDPRQLFAAVAPLLGADGRGGGALPPIAGVDPQHTKGVEQALRAWLTEVTAQVALNDTKSVAPPAWDPQRLEYKFTLTALTPDAAVQLPADEYDGAGVEWYSFDRAGWDSARVSAVEPMTTTVQPTPVSYPGMPRPRFWELEDGNVNLDMLRGGDPAQAVLVKFAHQYANDWFVVPLRTPAGITTIRALTVTDTFGAVTDVAPAAALDGGRGPWRMWELTSTDPEAAQGAGMRLLVPPVPKPLNGDILEDVLIVRDEMANLAWVVELTTRDAEGAKVDRYQRYLRARPPSDPTFDPASASAGQLTYHLGTRLPDYWYPLVSTTATNGRPLLTLADVPPEASGVDDQGVQGRVIVHSPSMSIADEEVPREGAHVTRQDRLMPGGPSVLVWRARTKTPGLGEASSGLRFDVLD